MRRRALLTRSATVAAVGLALLTGCSGGGEPKATVDPKAALTAAKASFDGAKFVGLQAHEQGRPQDRERRHGRARHR